MILGIYGSGGEGREVKESAEAVSAWTEIIFIDDTVETGEFQGCKRMPFSAFQAKYTPFESGIVIALGEPQYRHAVYHKVMIAGYKLVNVIHPTAKVSNTAKLGNGITLKAGVTVSTDVVIEDNVGVGIGVTVSHDTVVHSHSQISPHAVLAGHCEIGEETFIGLNVCIREGIKIGTQSVIGMGSTVVEDIPQDAVAYGNPARVMRPRGNSKVFG